jgi:hypothetical protein
MLQQNEAQTPKPQILPALSRKKKPRNQSSSKHKSYQNRIPKHENKAHQKHTLGGIVTV